MYCFEFSNSSTSIVVLGITYEQNEMLGWLYEYDLVWVVLSAGLFLYSGVTCSVVTIYLLAYIAMKVHVALYKIIINCIFMKKLKKIIFILDIFFC